MSDWQARLRTAANKITGLLAEPKPTDVDSLYRVLLVCPNGYKIDIGSIFVDGKEVRTNHYAATPVLQMITKEIK